MHTNICIDDKCKKNSKRRERQKTDETILGAFAKLQKPNISFVMSVRPTVRMEQLSSHWTDFHESLYLRSFRKSVGKIQNFVNHLTPNGHCMGRTVQLTSRCCILYISSTNIRTEYFKHAA